MATVTDEQLAEWKKLADRSSRGSWQWKLAREAVSALLDEVERLRAAAGERDALQKAVNEANINAADAACVSALAATDSAVVRAILDTSEAAYKAILAAVPTPAADDRLKWAEAGARAMLEAICIYVPAWQEATFRQGDEFDVAAVARRAVEE